MMLMICKSPLQASCTHIYIDNDNDDDETTIKTMTITMMMICKSPLQASCTQIYVENDNDDYDDDNDHMIMMMHKSP